MQIATTTSAGAQETFVPLKVDPVPESEIDFSPADLAFDPLSISEVPLQSAGSVDALADSLIFGELTLEEIEQLPFEQQKALIKNLEIRSHSRSALVDPKYLMGLQEKVACVAMVGVNNCRTAEQAARDSVAQTISLFGKSDGQDKSDAFRHCYWSALMTIRMNSKVAETIGNNHEKYSSERYEPHFPEDTEMDLYNNAQGRKVGAVSAIGPINSIKESQASTVCKQWADNGTLRTIR